MSLRKISNVLRMKINSLVPNNPDVNSWVFDSYKYIVEYILNVTGSVTR